MVLDISHTYWSAVTSYSRSIVDLSMIPSLKEVYCNSIGDFETSNIDVLKLNNNPNLEYIEIQENLPLRILDLKHSDQYIQSLSINYDYGFWPGTNCDGFTNGFTLCFELEYFNPNIHVNGECYKKSNDCALLMSMSEIETIEFDIFPNPAKDLFYLPPNTQFKFVEIYDLNSKKIKSFDKETTAFQLKI